MAKVKDETKVKLPEGDVTVLYYVDDVEGYGVEVTGDDESIKDISFGPEPELAEDLYDAVIDVLKKKGEKGIEAFSGIYCQFPDDMSGLAAAKAFIASRKESA